MEKSQFGNIKIPQRQLIRVEATKKIAYKHTARQTLQISSYCFVVVVFQLKTEREGKKEKEKCDISMEWRIKTRIR